MGRDSGARRAARAQTPRSTVLATVGILALFVAAIAGLIVASMRHSGDPAPVATGFGSASIEPTTSDSANAGPSVTPNSGAAAPSHPHPSRHLTVVPGQRLRQQKIVVVKPTSFTVASFNLLGASHTTGAHARKGYASGPARLSGELALIRAKGVTVAGLQEFQPPQVDAFRRLTGDTWGMYPGTSVDNSIVWLASDWKLVQAENHPFPYFHGRTVEDPAVLLQNIDSGRRIWFVNVHSPADVHGMHNAGLRAATVTREAQLAKQLSADGTPVILTGDMNDRQLFACSFTQQSGMHSSDGWRTVGGACEQGTGYPNVDWILGTSAVTFANGKPDFASEHQHLSDHPIITATATIAGSTTAVGG